MFIEPCDVLIETINILKNLPPQKQQQQQQLGMPLRILPKSYVHTCSSHEWSFMLTLKLPFKLIVRNFWGCFLMSGVRMLHFLKDWWKFIQIHQYYTMALNMINDDE